MAMVDENGLFTVGKMQTISGMLVELATEINLLSDLIAANPEYPLAWKLHPQFKKTRADYLSLISVSEDVLRRQTREEVLP